MDFGTLISSMNLPDILFIGVIAVVLSMRMTKQFTKLELYVETMHELVESNYKSYTDLKGRFLEDHDRLTKLDTRVGFLESGRKSREND